MEQSLIHSIKNLSTSPISLDALINEIPLGISLINKDRQLIMINRSYEALTGFSRDEVIGFPCWQILRCNHCIKDCPALKIVEDSEPICLESDIINRDRQLIPIRLNVAALKNQKDELIGFVETVEDLRPIRELDNKISQAFSFSQLIGRSPKMAKIYQILPILAQSDSSVLITGETGTGKDLVAEAIHQASNRAKSPFIKVNCGALPENLLESELFGHQKGSFTGAFENKPGRFRLAHNGTIYLTEIGDLPLTLQVKLLTFLDDHVIHPVGSTKGFQADVRIICGTHRNLEKMVKEGLFREDLLFRLNVVRIHLPPLRERENDSSLLIDHFLNSLNTKLNKQIVGFSSESLKILTAYRFPGNVREMRNIIEYAVNVCQKGKIRPEHLPSYITETNPLPIVTTDVAESEITITKQESSDNSMEAKTWPDQERKLIMGALTKTGGRRSEAAEMLGFGRSTLWRKMKQYKIG